MPKLNAAPPRVASTFIPETSSSNRLAIRAIASAFCFAFVAWLASTAPLARPPSVVVFAPPVRNLLRRSLRCDSGLNSSASLARDSANISAKRAALSERPRISSAAEAELCNTLARSLTPFLPGVTDPAIRSKG